MSTEFTADGPIDSSDAFENALTDLIRTAESNGVNPEGFYVDRVDGGHSDFEIQIIELAKQSSL